MKNSDVQREIDRMTESRKMNKRIRELAEKAGSTHKQSLGVYQFYTDELEKFAKLIVKECIQVCADRDVHHDGLYSVWADDCATRIGKHFGVEE